MRQGGRKLIAAGTALAAVAATLTMTAAPASAVPARSTISFWGPNSSYTGDAVLAEKVHAMELVGNVLYIGGNFQTISPDTGLGASQTVLSLPQPYLYAVDATTGVYLPGFAPVLGGEVHDLEHDPVTDTLFVAGAFTTVNGQPLTGLAALDPATGALKGNQNTLLNQGVGAGPPTAFALHLAGRSMYVGGQFTNVGGIARGQIARLNLDAGNQVMAFQSYVQGGRVLSLTSAGTSLYAGGEFTALLSGPAGEPVGGPEATRFLGAVDLVTGATVPTFLTNVPCGFGPWVPCENNPTRGRSVAVANGIVFVAFGGNWGRVGAYRASDGAELALWSVSGDAQAVAVAGNTLFAGGHFERITVGVAGQPARCHAFSATFNTVDDLQLTLQPEPHFYNAGHGGVFSILAPTADDTYWAGQVTRVEAPRPDADSCGGGSNAGHNQIVRMLEDGGPTDTQNPSAPSNVTRTDGSDGTITVSWTPSTDNTAVTAYYVQVGNSRRKLAPATATSAVLTAADGVDIANPGNIRVVARDPYGNTTQSANATIPPPVTPEGEFTPTATPARILDTRLGIGGPAVPVQGGTPRALKVTGVGGVPASGVSMVALNVTVTNPSMRGVLGLYPNGESAPTASNLNFTAGQTVPNLVLARVGTGGYVNIGLNAGSAHVIADVVGWVANASAPLPGSRTEALPPARALDTRIGLGRPAGRINGPQVIEVQVVPANQGYTGVIMNLTGVQPTMSTYVTAFPGNVAKPEASNLNLLPGEIRPNLVMVGVSPQGTVKLYNHSGQVDLVVDVVGRFKLSSGLDASTTGRIAAIPNPHRLVDTRITNDPVGPNTTQTRNLSALTTYAPPGAPVRGVILNATATQASASTFLTLWPSDKPRPVASNVNITPGRDVPNLALAALSPTNQLSVYNLSGSVHYVLDATAVVLG